MADNENIVLRCEDSLEGIFTGIYEAYALRMPHECIHLQTAEEENMRLFTVYRTVKPDSIKTEKVIRTLRTRFGEKDYMALCLAAAASSMEKAEAIYKTVVWGLSGRCRGSILEHLTNDDVRRTLELSRSAGNELHRMKQFLRFAELEGGVLYAVICLLYTSDAADDCHSVDLGGRRIIKKIFFKQKTAYEIILGLVGSEMCIRDRNIQTPPIFCHFSRPKGRSSPLFLQKTVASVSLITVSYTHLTLPTTAIV